MVFSHWPREDSFLLSRALGGTCQRLSCLCNILLQDLTPLRVKITRGTYLLSVCRRTLKLTTYWHTVSYSYISFLNKSSQLLWVLGTAGSCRFFSITWRMVSRNSFSKTVYNVINVRHLLCTIFVRKTTCQKYSFKSFPKKIVNLKNPDLDLIGFTFSLEEDIRLLIPSQFAFILLRFSSKKEL